MIVIFLSNKSEKICHNDVFERFKCLEMLLVFSSVYKYNLHLCIVSGKKAKQSNILKPPSRTQPRLHY